MSVDREHLPKGIGADIAARLHDELGRAGVEVAPPHGVTLEARVESGSLVAGEQLRHQVYDALADGRTLNVAIGGDASQDAVTGTCEAVARAARDAGAPPSGIGLVLATRLPFDAFRLRSGLLGDGPVYVLAGAEMLLPGEGSRPDVDRFWRQLWRARLSRRIRLAFASDVRPVCGLLAAEPVRTVLPGAELQAPAGSAWVTMQVDLLRHATACGDLDDSSLDAALRLAVDSGDALHDSLQWPTATMRHDAWLNRRLGIGIVGIGDLLRRRGLDPRRFRSLAEMDEILRHVRSVLAAASRAAAVRTHAVPALESADPCRYVSGASRGAWQARWQSAVESAAVRHRNLLVLSPYSLFPRAAGTDRRFADLAPLLRHADACAAPVVPQFGSWNLNDFKRFHQRIFAVLQQRQP